MRFLLAVLLLLVSLALARTIQPLAEAEYQGHFTSFITQHKKTYDTAEFFHRYNIFKQNLDMIHSHNAGNQTYTLGLNEYADLTWEEFSAVKKGLKRPHNKIGAPRRSAVQSKLGSVPDSIDWRQKGAVTPVKNQGQCGSCWSFSTTGAMEGAWVIAGNQLTSFSEQQLVDCSSSYGNNGCNGGWMDNAFKYIIANGLTTEAAYPYTAQDGTCKSFTPQGWLYSFVDNKEGDEAGLLTLAAQGPVSVAIEADQSAFQFYSSGVFTAKCGTSLDHGVLVVGYGTDSGKDYWIVKNSWGTSWGEQGYIRLQRGDNKCGIALAASQPSAVKSVH